LPGHPENNISDGIVNILFDFYNTAISNSNSDTEKIYRNFSYCWENEPTAQRAMERACKQVDEADTLIIIGYSFPYVNRSFDDEILSNLYNVERIIIQDPMSDENFQLIERRIKKITEKLGRRPEIEHVKGTNEFVLPD
jgi:hypothetical protein